MAEVKEAYPIQLAEYAVANNIADEPAFKWWIHKILKRKERIIKKVKSKYWLGLRSQNQWNVLTR